MVIWNSKIAAKVKFAYQIFYGSINPSNQYYNPKLREILSYFNRCLVCRLTDKEWKHPQGIVVSGKSSGRCSAKVAEPIVPQFATKQTYEVKTNFIGNNLESVLQIKKLSPNAVIPSRATSESIGYDLYATNKVTVPTQDNALIDTGIAMTPPKGCYVRIAPRSGLALKKKIQVGAGVIDPDYTGEVKVILFNHGKDNFEIKPGERIAQIILEQAKTAPIKILDHLKPTGRQDKGFGSSNLAEVQEVQVSSNICESNPKTSRYQKINNDSKDLIILPKIMERPPGCSFLGSKPTTATVALGQMEGPNADIIIDSGSDITLVSPKTLAMMPEPPKNHQGKKVTLSQVTAKSSIEGYVDLPLFFSTKQGPIQMDVEAYVVKGMTTPMILGNDFADQYSLSITREDGKSTLHFSNTGRVLELQNTTSTSHIPTEVKTFLSTIKSRKHKITNKLRKKLRNKKSFFTVDENVTIPPFTSKSIIIKIPWLDNMKEAFLEVKDLEDNRLAALQILDTLITKGKNKIMVINPTDCPIQLIKGDELGSVLDPNVLDEQVEASTSEEITKFTNHTKAVLNAFRKVSKETKEEEEHAEAQPEQPPGPKTAEVPEFEHIPREELISALDINPRLDSKQKKQLEKVLTRNYQAFSLDGRIGKYEGIQYNIKLVEGATPVSLPPYTASPEKREAIDKQLDKWYSQDVIEPSDSPWGAPVIVVYRFGNLEYVWTTEE